MLKLFNIGEYQNLEISVLPSYCRQHQIIQKYVLNNMFFYGFIQNGELQQIRISWSISNQEVTRRQVWNFQFINQWNHIRIIIFIEF